MARTELPHPKDEVERSGSSSGGGHKHGVTLLDPRSRNPTTPERFGMSGQGRTMAIEALPKVGNVLRHDVYVGVSRCHDPTDDGGTYRTVGTVGMLGGWVGEAVSSTR